MSHDILFEEDAICESCGTKGAFDFLGDMLCLKCSGLIGNKKGDVMGELKLGGGEYKCPKCGIPVFGSTLHHCDCEKTT